MSKESKKQIYVFSPREDGLVYSSDGARVFIQAGIDKYLESVADMRLGSVLKNVSSEDQKSETESTLQSDILSVEKIVDPAVHDDTISSIVRARSNLLAQILEICANNPL